MLSTAASDEYFSPAPNSAVLRRHNSTPDLRDPAPEGYHGGLAGPSAEHRPLESDHGRLLRQLRFRDRGPALRVPVEHPSSVSSTAAAELSPAGDGAPPFDPFAVFAELAPGPNEQIVDNPLYEDVAAPSEAVLIQVPQPVLFDDNMALNASITAIEPWAWGPTELFIRNLRSVVGPKLIGANIVTPEALMSMFNACIDPHSDHGRWHASIAGTLIAKALAAKQHNNAGAVLDVTDLMNFYIQQLEEHWASQRSSAIELELQTAKQLPGELPSTLWSRLSRLKSQVPHMCTDVQLVYTYLQALTSSAARSHVWEVLHKVARPLWIGEFPKVAQSADTVMHNSAIDNNSFSPFSSSSSFIPSLPTAAPAPVSSAAPAAPEPQQYRHPRQDPPPRHQSRQPPQLHCAIHGYGGHSTAECRIARNQGQPPVSHAAASNRHDWQHHQEYYPRSAFSTNTSSYHQPSPSDYHPPQPVYAAQPYAPPPYAPQPVYSTPPSYAPQPTYSSPQPAPYGHHAYSPRPQYHSPPSHHPAPPSHYPPSSYTPSVAPSSAPAFNNQQSAAFASQSAGRPRYSGQPCSTCGGMHSEQRCWSLRPEQAPPGWEPKPTDQGYSVWLESKRKLLERLGVPSHLQPRPQQQQQQQSPSSPQNRPAAAATASSAPPASFPPDGNLISFDYYPGNHAYVSQVGTGPVPMSAASSGAMWELSSSTHANATLLSTSVPKSFEPAPLPATSAPAPAAPPKPSVSKPSVAKDAGTFSEEELLQALSDLFGDFAARLRRHRPAAAATSSTAAFVTTATSAASSDLPPVPADFKPVTAMSVGERTSAYSVNPVAAAYARRRIDTFNYPPGTARLCSIRGVVTGLRTLLMRDMAANCNIITLVVALALKLPILPTSQRLLSSTDTGKSVVGVVDTSGLSIELMPGTPYAVSLPLTETLVVDQPPVMYDILIGNQQMHLVADSLSSYPTPTLTYRPNYITHPDFVVPISMHSELPSPSRAHACATFLVPEPETEPMEPEPESLPLHSAAASYGVPPDRTTPMRSSHASSACDTAMMADDLGFDPLDSCSTPKSFNHLLGPNTIASSSRCDTHDAPASAATTAAPLDHSSGGLECGGDETSVKQPSGTAAPVPECGGDGASQNQPRDAGTPMLFKRPYFPLVLSAEHILLAPLTYGAQVTTLLLAPFFPLMQLLCALMPYAIRMFERMLYPALRWTKHGTIKVANLVLRGYFSLPQRIRAYSRKLSPLLLPIPALLLSLGVSAPFLFMSPLLLLAWLSVSLLPFALHVLEPPLRTAFTWATRPSSPTWHAASMEDQPPSKRVRTKPHLRMGNRKRSSTRGSHVRVPCGRSVTSTLIVLLILLFLFSFATAAGATSGEQTDPPSLNHTPSNLASADEFAVSHLPRTTNVCHHAFVNVPHPTPEAISTLSIISGVAHAFCALTEPNPVTQGPSALTEPNPVPQERALPKPHDPRPTGDATFAPSCPGGLASPIAFLVIRSKLGAHVHYRHPVYRARTLRNEAGALGPRGLRWPARPVLRVRGGLGQRFKRPGGAVNATPATALQLDRSPPHRHRHSPQQTPTWRASPSLQQLRRSIRRRRPAWRLPPWPRRPRRKKPSLCGACYARSPW